MAKRRVRRSRGNYNFTYKRKAALYRAAQISAKKRRNRRIKVAAGVVAGLAGAGAVAYLGHRHGGKAVAAVRDFKPQMSRARNKVAAKIAVSPQHKEKTRVKSAISKAKPSATKVSSPITEGDRARAAETRKALEKAQLPPHMGGPDKRIYNEDDTVNTEAMTNRSARSANRKRKSKRLTVSSTKNVLNMTQDELRSVSTGRKIRSKAPVLGSSKRVKRPAPYKGSLADAAFAQWIEDYEKAHG